jgi:hypothetical protein
MSPRTALILVVVGVLFVALVHAKDVGYAIGYAAARIMYAPRL